MRCLKRISEEIKDNEQMQYLKRIVVYLYAEIEEESLEKIIKILEESEREEDMSTVQERIGREFRNERKIGRKEAITEIIRSMLLQNQDNETIIKFTKASEKEIEEIRKELVVKP